MKDDTKQRQLARRRLLQRLRPGSPRWHQVLKKIQRTDEQEKR